MELDSFWNYKINNYKADLLYMKIGFFWGTLLIGVEVNRHVIHSLIKKTNSEFTVRLVKRTLPLYIFTLPL